MNSRKGHAFYSDVMFLVFIMALIEAEMYSCPTHASPETAYILHIIMYYEASLHPAQVYVRRRYYPPESSINLFNYRNPSTYRYTHKLLLLYHTNYDATLLYFGRQYLTSLIVLLALASGVRSRAAGHY